MRFFMPINIQRISQSATAEKQCSLLCITYKLLTMIKEKREKVIPIRLTKTEHDALKKKADEMRTSASELMRLTFKTICYV